MVDDRAANRAAFEAVLSEQGLKVVLAGSGEEALKHTLERDFAVILLDIRMPGLDGYETAELLRKRERTRQTPIIFMSAYDSTPSQVAKAYVAGAIDYLFSPVDDEVLKLKVAAFVELYRKNAALRQRLEELDWANAALQAEVAASRGAETQLKERARELETALRKLEAEMSHLRIKPVR